MKDEGLLIDKLEFGDFVRVKDDTPKKYFHRKFGIISGQRTIEDAETASKYGEPIGAVLYLFESSDGDSIEIPEKYLELN